MTKPKSVREKTTDGPAPGPRRRTKKAPAAAAGQAAPGFRQWLTMGIALALPFLGVAALAVAALFFVLRSRGN